jgi:hypothetical protein
MAFSAFISSALPSNSVEDVRRVFTQLDVGVIEKIDSKDYEGRDGRPLRKFWIHFSSSTETGKRFHARLASNDARQKNGETVLVSDIPRIVYNTRRDGSDMYWYVYNCKTPTERAAEQEARVASTTANVRIEM